MSAGSRITSGMHAGVPGKSRKGRICRRNALHSSRARRRPSTRLHVSPCHDRAIFLSSRAALFSPLHVMSYPCSSFGLSFKAAKARRVEKIVQTPAESCGLRSHSVNVSQVAPAVPASSHFTYASLSHLCNFSADPANAKQTRCNFLLSSTSLVSGLTVETLSNGLCCCLTELLSPPAVAKPQVTTDPSSLTAAKAKGLA